MLKALTKKQFAEMFRSYFVNQKTGKVRSKGGTIAFFGFFVFLMLFLAAVFFGVSYAIGEGLCSVGMDWLYFSMMGIFAVALGTFGSVFNTYASLYLSKDNDLLISMPIPPRTILISRLIGVCGMALLYSGIVWVPAFVYYMIFQKPDAAGIVCSILLTFIILAFVSFLTCLLGWLVAAITSRLRRKNILTTLLSLIFLGTYYFVCMRMSDVIEAMLANTEKVGNAMRGWGFLFYQLGMAATGDWKAMLIFSGITIALSIICFVVMERTFLRISTVSIAEKKSAYRASDVKTNGKKKALFLRELHRFTGSSTYMLNCALGIVFLPAVTIMAWIRYDLIHDALSQIFSFVPELMGFLPLVVLLVIGGISSMNVISTPSISLEGKHLWILQSSPISPKEVLHAKEMLHLVVNAPVALLCGAALSICMKLSLAETVLVLILVLLVIMINAKLGLILGLLRPNLHWTAETQPIKQSLNVLIVMIAGIVSVIAPAAGYYFVGDFMSITLWMFVVILLYLALVIWMTYWLDHKGSRLFAEL